MRFILIGLLLMFACAPADAAESIRADYALMAGGVRMIDVNATFDLQQKKYKVRTEAKTIGVFAKILPWTGAFETTGVENYLPTNHAYDVGWRGHNEKRGFVYDPPGVLKSMYLVEDNQTRDAPVDADMAKDTRDMLSAIMAMIDRFERNGSCAGDTLSYDGKRSFIIRVKDAGEATMNNPNLSSYTGLAHGCSVEIIPQKGKWPKKPRGWLRIQKQAEGRLPVIWLAHPKKDAIAIPVRVDIHTKYGDVIAHLVALQ